MQLSASTTSQKHVALKVSRANTPSDSSDARTRTRTPSSGRSSRRARWPQRLHFGRVYMTRGRLNGETFEPRISGLANRIVEQNILQLLPRSMEEKRAPGFMPTKFQRYLNQGVLGDFQHGGVQ
ncbi:hypothetical protein PUN28_012126 [Cardiocondyla obscurior]|uniref:Uncharacterized protein n=1 Tax=Cardiocondyla obscurior TaxID=286306 RepID=A0AAW2FCI3_9HYME